MSPPPDSTGAEPRLAPPSLADLRAGFLVFLIALPLCLGISMASGFPPVAGILTAIVGGVLGTLAGGAPLTIKGPAAGLIVIALGAVQELGEGDALLGYQRALAVGVVAAGVQILFALLRAGSYGLAMPPAVVHGMLAAIGVIIISNQAHIVLGVTPYATEPLPRLAEIPLSLARANPKILPLGLASLAILVLWPRWNVWVRRVPAPVVVLAVTVPAGLLLGIGRPHELELLGRTWRMGPELLVSLPGSLLDAVALPDFSAISSPTSIKYVAMFALVGSIESVLSVLAVGALDPLRRPAPLNRDLFAVGLGNLAAASIGGLPMISEIVRSKANIDAGARSSWANLFHGLCLLVFVALVPGLLQRIPLAALAAMLVYTGARLASPREIAAIRRIGPDQLLLFASTLLATLATDLLVGVAAGLALTVALHLLRGVPPLALLRTRCVEERAGDVLRLKLLGAATFANLLSLRRRLARADEGVRRVVIDLGEVALVDHTFLSRVHALLADRPEARLELANLDGLRAASAHPLASRRRARGA